MAVPPEVSGESTVSPLRSCSFTPLVLPYSVSVLLAQCSVWVVSGPACNSNITVIDPARSNTVLDQFSLPPTAPALSICAVPPVGQCCHIPLQQLHLLRFGSSIVTVQYKHLEHRRSFLCFFLYQVTLQELCGLELRKEGSTLRINVTSISSVSALLFDKPSVFLHLPLPAYSCTQLQLAKKPVCSLFPSLKVFIHSRELMSWVIFLL